MVNVQESPVTAQIVLDEIEKENLTGSIYEMSGYELEEENSFETPEKVAPKQYEIKVKGNTINHKFPKQSITIMRFN
ncbi:alpha-L-arabinofuranosidase C-terminal domain-containing protein [Neobacillus sp. CF12]|uniref:alpha-L-arabinofuranosidase C-terminal domain-containing protein n=1 Tax=Neobacillus sp. CF12 TaxID=3055864 RepID=UPI0025A099AD|nr:alpha-L-arabinofuranosidase C-terminal domain-containing protein [Neobacillus sp. CF12]MDM5327817.1 alpha-L-arabinofuranosidase C-terminal domain-containing protein [Neobacillus sp. CF12]